MSWHCGCPPSQTHQFSSNEVTANRRSWHPAIRLACFRSSVRRATSPFHSGDGKRTNWRDTEANNRGAAALSDGPNVTDMRAAVCEGQAWRAAEQRARRADAQSRTGVKKNRKKEKLARCPWHVAPLCSAGLWRRRQLAYFHPPCLRQNPWVCLFPPSSLHPCVSGEAELSVSLYRKILNQIKQISTALFKNATQGTQVLQQWSKIIMITIMTIKK